MTHSRQSAEQAGAGDIHPVVAAITHELRTPLQAIIGFSQLAMLDWPTGVDRRYLTQIDQASRLMLRVVNDLLDLSHLESGTLEIEHDQPLEPHSLLQQVLSTAESLRLDKPIRLYASADEHCPRRLRGDPKRIEQILLNLLSNAVRFTDQGEVSVGVRLLHSSAEEAVLRWSIADTGMGMDAQTLAWLCQPVTSAQRGGAPRRGGAGFGLSIVRRLLELHGAELKVASVQGGGTLMWFDLTLVAEANGFTQKPARSPDALVFTQDAHLFQTVRTQWAAQESDVRRADSPDTAPCAAPRWVIDAQDPSAQSWLARARALGCEAWLVQASPVLEGAASGSPLLTLAQLPLKAFAASSEVTRPSDPALRGMRVLVVEDNLLNQRVIRDLLSRMGVESVMADTGARAQVLLAQGGWHAMLLDMQLPDMTGLGLARWMREQHHVADVPFAFLSAYLSPDDRIAAQVLGAQTCLLKPAEPQELLKLLLSVRPSHVQAGGGLNRTQAGLLALSNLDIKQLMRSEWPVQRLALQRAQDPQALRKAIHAVRGSLAMLGPSPSLQVARTLEESLIAGEDVSRSTLLAFMDGVEAFLAESRPNPG